MAKVTKRRSHRPRLLGTVLTLAVGIGLGASIHAAVAAEPVGTPPADFSRYQKLDLFARALAIIEQHYVRPVDSERLMYGALDGLVSELDPHTDFLRPEDAQMLREDIDGRFGGVGLVVTMERDDDKGGTVYLAIRDVIPAGPAAKQGIEVGDRIVNIEGKEVSQYVDLRDAIRVMRGEKGTSVTFTVVKPGKTPRSLTVVRDIIDAPAVETKYLGDGIGVLRLRDFQKTSARELQSGLTSLRDESSGKLRGVVLDLRDNGGGLLDQAIATVDLFVSDGVIVRTRGRHGRLTDEARARRPGTWATVPLVVLINKASASASEIVAGALQDHQRALIIGERSYGKGSVQAPFELDDGSVLKLTTALYYTPHDRLIQASGIAPDVRAGPNPAEYADSRPELEPERADPQHLKPEDFGREALPAEDGSAAVDAAENDHQLAVAVQHLQAWDRIAPKSRLRRR
jgi:carboxyl-terminal processing protease